MMDSSVERILHLAFAKMGEVLDTLGAEIVATVPPDQHVSALIAVATALNIGKTDLLRRAGGDRLVAAMAASDALQQGVVVSDTGRAN